MKEILVIDRETINRTIMRLLLENIGHKVTEAMTCEEGIKKIAEGQFAMVITDIRTTDDSMSLSGFDVITTAKARGIRVILSAKSLTPGEQDYCLAFPPDAFLQKPFENSYFQTIVAVTLLD